MTKLILCVLLGAARAGAQAFDIYRPPAAKSPAPMVMFIHGGAWVGGTKEQYAEHGRAFARAGWCAVVIDYHLAPEFKHPRPIEDLEVARRSVTKTPGPGCDPRRLFMVGHSAGAHAVATWATHHTGAVAGFVGLEGIYDIPKLARRWPDYPELFLNAEFGPAARWAAASPTRLTLKNKAPWLVIHAGGDELVDPAQTADFVTHLRQQKIEVKSFDPGVITHFEVVDRLRNVKSDVFTEIAKLIRNPRRGGD